MPLNAARVSAAEGGGSGAPSACVFLDGGMAHPLMEEEEERAEPRRKAGSRSIESPCAGCDEKLLNWKDACVDEWGAWVYNGLYGGSGKESGGVDKGL